MFSQFPLVDLSELTTMMIKFDFRFSIPVPGDSTLTDTGRKKNHRMSRSEAKFIADMVKSHGTNYKVIIVQCSFGGYNKKCLSHTY